MAEENKDRMTTREEEEKLKDQKERGLQDEVKEDVPPDNPPSQLSGDEEEREQDVREQKDKKQQLREREDT